jgi:hypothetical protein
MTRYVACVLVLSAWLVRPAIALATNYSVDGLPIDVDRQQFENLRPQAVQTEPSDIPKVASMVYFPSNVSFRGVGLEAVTRGFEEDRGCMLALSFKPMSFAQAERLVDRLKEDLRVIAPAGPREHLTVAYLEGEQVRAVVLREDHKGADESKIGFVVSLKTCDLGSAQRIWGSAPKAR